MNKPDVFFEFNCIIRDIAMDRGRRAMPVQNKAYNQRYIKRCQEMHRQKV